MTSVPEAIIRRRADLDRLAQACRNEAARLGELLEIEQGGLSRILMRLAEVNACIAAIEDAAKTPSAEAAEGGAGAVARVPATEAENAPAGSVEASGADMGIPISPALIADEPKKPRGPVEEDGYPGSLMPPKKPRAPKRDIRAMVLDEAERRPDQSLLPAQIAQALDVPLRAVVSAIAYWQAKGRLTLDGGVVRLVETDIGIPISPPVEITGQGEGVAEDGITYGVGGLIAFLQAEPDSTMAEINAAGIPAPEVYRAEKEGVVIAKAHGLYALVESEQRAAE